jgi:hypothetical protein
MKEEENKIKDENKKASDGFKVVVLDNGCSLFDGYDQNIIRSHLSNFVCIWHLGVDFGKNMKEQEYKKEIEGLNKDRDEWRDSGMEEVNTLRNEVNRLKGSKRWYSEEQIGEFRDTIKRLSEQLQDLKFIAYENKKKLYLQRKKTDSIVSAVIMENGKLKRITGAGLKSLLGDKNG